MFLEGPGILEIVLPGGTDLPEGRVCLGNCGVGENCKYKHLKHLSVFHNISIISLGQ